MEEKWTCPCCGTENIDDCKYTAIPACSKCGMELEWWDIDGLKENPPKIYERVKEVTYANNNH